MSNPHIPSNDPETSEFQKKTDYHQKLADLSPNLLFVIDLRERRIIYVNNRVQDLLELNPEDVYDKGPEIFKTVLHPDDYQRRQESLEKWKNLSDQEETEAEVRFWVGKKEWQWFKITDKVFEREEDGTVSQIIGTAQNIHGQKIFKEKLKEEHRRFKNAQAIGHIGSFERKLPGDVVIYSEEFYHILGLEPKQDEISLEEFMSHVHPEDRETYLAAIHHTHATGEPLDIVNRVIRPDGSIRHVHRRAVIIKDEHGTPLRVYGTVQDITERLLAEEERKKSEWLMRSTEILAGTGSYEADLVTNRIYFSEGLFRLFGEEPGDFEPTFEWLDSRSHPEDTAKVRQIMEKAAVNREPYTYTRRIYHKDGRLRIVEAQGNVLTDTEGNTTKLIGLVQDITERKEAEEELRKSEERSRNLLNVLQNAPDAYLVLTPDLYIEMASDAYLEATFTKREEIIGKNLFDVFPETPAVNDASGMRNLRASFDQVLTSKKPHRMAIQHYEVPRPEGGFKEKYWSPTNSPVVNAAGEVEYLIHRVLDVTEVIQKQKTLKGYTSKTEMLKNTVEEISIQAEQLKESRALLKSVFDASPNSIVLYRTIYDKKGEVEDFEFHMVNSFTFSTTGQDTSIIGKKFSDIFPNSVETGVLDAFKRTAETGVPADFETWYEGEGMAQWFHIRASKIDDYLVATIEDITGRKKTEETLKQMFNGSFSAITMLDSLRDEQGKIIDFVLKGGNKAAENILGVAKEEFVGKRLLDVWPGVKDVFFDTYVRVVEEGIPLRTQNHYNHENFDHWFDVSAIKNGDGFIMTYHDITEQKKAEQELLNLKDQLAKRVDESEYRFSSLVTASSDTIYKMSADWKTMHHLQGKDFLSGTAGGANSSWIEDYIPEPERPKYKKAIREAIQNKNMFELEHQVFDSNGNVGWTYSRAIPSLSINGKIVEWLGVTSNITARKKAEERQSFLLKLSDTLRSLTDPEKMINIALKNLGQHLYVDRAYYSEALPDGDTLLIRSGYLKDVPPLPEKIKISDLDTGIRKVYLQGQTLVLNDSLKDLEPNEKMDKARNETQIRAGIGVPLVKHEKLVAVVGVQQSTPRLWAAEEIALVEEVGERTWAAVERAQAEKALREAQESLNIAIEAAQMGTWILDFTSATTERNFRHDQIFGYDIPQPEWNHGVARKHVLREDQAIFDAAFAIAFKTGKLEFEVRVRWQNGSIHWMAVNGHFYFDENGKPLRGAGVNFEVTERRQAEQALRESEQRFRNLVEASALAVWETDPEGIVVVDSPSWRAFTGQTFEDWRGTGWMKAVHPDDREAAGENWKKTVASRKNFNYEFRLRSAEGDYRWTNIKAIPILDTEGRVIKWTGMNLDIHDRKKVEEALIKAKEEAEAASRAKEDFVSTISHEIRTPLNAVIGITNLLLDQNPREDQKENLNSLSFSANNLLTLINDILDFSKLEAGKTALAENVFDLPDLLLSLKQAHQPQARAKGTELNLNLGKDIPQRISTDQLKLSQILHNLVSNAVKFTSGGQVNISVNLHRQDKELVWLDFRIQDTGIGIAPDKVEHIFEKFAQAESSTVRHYGGTGLGLSITKLLLDLMDSEIKVKSKPGEGSSFYFCLQVKVVDQEIPSEERPEKRENIEDLRHINLLLVEDVDINRKIILQFLQNWWQVHPDEAINGKEAVEKAKTRYYDLILMDVRMPVMDGYEATSQIRKLPGYENIPILALTADKNQEVQQALHATQFSDLLTKPFDPKELKQRIIQHISASGKNLEDIKESETEPLQAEITSKEDPEELNEFLHLCLQHLQEYKKIFIKALAERDREKLFHLEHKSSFLNKRLGLEGLAKILKKAMMLLAETADKDKLEEILAKGKKLYDNAIKELQEKLAEPPLEISRYKNIAGENREILQKLIGNSVRAFETYREDFITAAKEEDREILSDLVHKNTTSIHYIQANRLAGKIEEYRELLKSPAVEKDRLKKKKDEVLQEFDKVIGGLKELED